MLSLWYEMMKYVFKTFVWVFEVLNVKIRMVGIYFQKLKKMIFIITHIRYNKNNNKMTKTQTRLIFNERYMSFIQKAKNELDVNRLKSVKLKIDINTNMPSNDKNSIMTSIPMSEILKFQQEYREYIVENQSDFDLTNNGKIILDQPISQPDFFVLVISLIVDDITNYNSFQEIFDEGFNSKKQGDIFKVSLWNEESGDYEESDFKCACSHKCCPENSFHIYNPITEYNIIVGDSCIEKTKIISKEELNKIQKEKKSSKYYNDLIKKRQIKNKMKMKNKLINELEFLEINIDNVKTEYKIVGGNFGIYKEDMEKFMQMLKDCTELNDIEIGNLIEELSLELI